MVCIRQLTNISQIASYTRYLLVRHTSPVISTTYAWASQYTSCSLFQHQCHPFLALLSHPRNSFRRRNAHLSRRTYLPINACPKTLVIFLQRLENRSTTKPLVHQAVSNTLHRRTLNIYLIHNPVYFLREKYNDHSDRHPRV